MWDLVGNPEDRFSQNEAHLYFSMHHSYKRYLRFIEVLDQKKKNMIVMINIAKFMLF